MSKDVVLTGLRSNAEFHLGNYLGAILPMVELQRKHAGQYQLNMFIPDLHSFTTPIDHGKLYEQTHQNLKVFVAAGLDIDQPDTFIYRQSYIPAHSEMTWILDCFTGFGEMIRMTQFKEKGRDIFNQAAEEHSGFVDGDKVLKDPQEHLNLVVSKANDRTTVGLFNYPVLMAADILLYGAKYVPVGEDQRQHVEFTRDLAQRFNKNFGDIFQIPADSKEQIGFQGLDMPIRIRSLRHPTKKMSKSADDSRGTILLTDKPHVAAQKILAATTDGKGVINFKFNSQPGVSNMIQILALLSGAGLDEMAERYEGQTNYMKLKEDTAKKVMEFLEDFQSKLDKVDEKRLKQKLEDDEAAMSKIADSTLLKVQQAVGLRPKT